MVFMSEHVATQSARELPLGGVGPDVGLAHHFRLESPLAPGVGTRVGSLGVVHAFVLVQSGFVGVSEPAYVAQDAALGVDLSVRMHGRTDAGSERALAALEDLLHVALPVVRQVGFSGESFAALVAEVLALGSVRGHVFPEVPQPAEHLVALFARERPRKVLLLDVPFPLPVLRRLVAAVDISALHGPTTVDPLIGRHLHHLNVTVTVMVVIIIIIIV